MTTEDSNGGMSGAAKLLDRAIQMHAPQVLALNPDNLDAANPTALMLPQGMRLESLKPFMDPYRTRPLRRKGSTTLTDLESFIDHVNRFKGDGAEAAMFCLVNPSDPRLTSILNYHEAMPADGKEGLTGHGDHRGDYSFPLSDAWTAWAKVDGAKMTQVDFAEFLEDRIADIIAPPTILTGGADPDATGVVAIGSDSATPKPGAAGDFGPKTMDEQLADLLSTIGGRVAGPRTMMELSRGLALYANSKFVEKRDLASGEAALAYEETHVDKAGKPIKVPTLFLIAIPVFQNGAVYRIAVRLRYRAAGGGVTWFFERYRVREAFEHAVREAATRAHTETGVPLFFGSPEKAAS